MTPFTWNAIRHLNFTVARAYCRYLLPVGVAAVSAHYVKRSNLRIRIRELEEELKRKEAEREDARQDTQNLLEWIKWDERRRGS